LAIFEVVASRGESAVAPQNFFSSLEILASALAHG
jgi:hypothetical protein